MIGADELLDYITLVWRRCPWPAVAVSVVWACCWLGQTTDLERKITQDSKRARKDEVAALKAEAVKRAG